VAVEVAMAVVAVVLLPHCGRYRSSCCVSCKYLVFEGVVCGFLFRLVDVTTGVRTGVTVVHPGDGRRGLRKEKTERENETVLDLMYSSPAVGLSVHRWVVGVVGEEVKKILSAHSQAIGDLLRKLNRRIPCEIGQIHRKERAIGGGGLD
jgi:hypothetical protein